MGGCTSRGPKTSGKGRRLVGREWQRSVSLGCGNRKDATALIALITPEAAQLVEIGSHPGVSSNPTNRATHLPYILCSG